jgi:heme/copper-type cytochrome/quinol oxidase subunit 2
VDTTKYTYNYTVGEEGIIEAEGGLSIGIILLIVGIVLIVIGAGVACYIRKRNAIRHSRNAQLL